MLSTRDPDHRVVAAAGPDGDLTASVFTPRARTASGTGIYFLHGGGMIIGDRFTGMANVLDWALEHDAVVVSLDYRLAPEHPAPAPVEDAYAGFVWTAAHAAELGIDPERILLAGTSAGGGLAAGVALLARDRKGPQALARLLMSPMLDDRDETVSTRQYSGTGSWSRESNTTGWTALLGASRGTEAVSAYRAPARAEDPSGLPPAFIDVGSVEVFRDEDVAYASGLWAAGVQAELHVWAGGFHIFDGAAPSAALSTAALAARTAWVRRILGA
ncbi:alpha/beta hydrolase [Streptomyces roseolus]|uniref:alpha/beta hydrolase n=1 Tax=Streptomyces roseolus TaxID=67358 RepID=UPI0037933FE6